MEMSLKKYELRDSEDEGPIDKVRRGVGPGTKHRRFGGKNEWNSVGFMKSGPGRWVISPPSQTPGLMSIKVTHARENFSSGVTVVETIL